MKNTIIFLLLIYCSVATPQQPESRLTIVFYNTENLYDTLDAPGTDDSGFTPGGVKKWNSQKYFRKVNDLGRVLSSIDEKKLPEIIGLSGVENIRVLQDLVRSKPLEKAGYEIVHKDSPDKQGSDVAFLFRKDQFRLSGKDFIPVQFPFDSSLTIRDILHVYGELSDGRLVHFFVNHWSSRDGGQRETESQRMYCAVALRRAVDMLLSRDSRARIIIMGDFNDEPTNKSLMNVVQCSNKRKNIAVGEFYNLMYDQHNLNPTGSCFYQGSWSMMDQIIVSPNMLSAFSGFGCNYESAKVFQKDWMIISKKEGVPEPHATYDGDTYSGGVSDHLPVYVVLEK